MVTEGPTCISLSGPIYSYSTKTLWCCYPYPKNGHGFNRKRFCFSVVSLAMEKE